MRSYWGTELSGDPELVESGVEVEFGVGVESRVEMESGVEMEVQSTEMQSHGIRRRV